jgi:hypothetical protein
LVHEPQPLLRIGERVRLCFLGALGISAFLSVTLVGRSIPDTREKITHGISLEVAVLEKLWNEFAC